MKRPRTYSVPSGSETPEEQSSGIYWTLIGDEAADEIERLRAELVKAVTALPQAVRNERERCASICDGIGAGYAGAARRLEGQHATHAAGQRDGANECAAAIRRA